MKYTPISIIALILFAVSYSCGPAVTEANMPKVEVCPIVGSWSMKAIHWVTKDTTYSIPEAQPGVLIITPGRYSIMWTPTEKPRTPFENLSEPSEEELIAGFRSVVFNTGTYVYTDSTITTTAEIAKVPGFEGGIQYYRYALQGDELTFTMFDETYPDGTKPAWFGRYETKFVLERLE